MGSDGGRRHDAAIAQALCQGQGEANPSLSPVREVLPGQADLSTDSCVEYQTTGMGIGHLWGLSPTNHPFVLLAGWPVAIRYVELSQSQYRFYLGGIR